jgi:predicted AAA+ superfamily ATPase
MALTNQERVGKCLELLRQGLGPFTEREFKSRYHNEAHNEALRYLNDDPMAQKRAIGEWDTSLLLKVVIGSWNDIFKLTLGNAERNLVHELRDVRNRWAHQDAFSSDDAERALDSAYRLLTALVAPQAEEIGKMKYELRRLVFDEQVRKEKNKAGGTLIEVGVSSVLKPWREVVTPHADVASGRYQQAEFAADLWQVHLGEGSDEYLKPQEFFRRTYLTESLKRLLVGGVQRLSGTGGDPVVQLQTNFGGGKTHSMLALYHLFSGMAPTDLPGIDGVMAEAKVSKLPKARRVVLVGNKLSPGNPVTKADGTVVRTLWGELAYQLGGTAAYARVALDDEKATSPGDVLRELFVEYGPSLILVDEWVAYARQLHDQNDLPGGGFETQFSFAQTLTESAKLAGNCLLVVSLPASDTSGSPHTIVDDVEVGGIRGREALDRLRNVVGRIESSWRPATAEEGFEIVRRRLFEPLAGDQFKNRDVTARAFSELYNTHQAEFPPECRSPDYEKRLQAAYPIHPEIFDRLYTDWSTLVKFQRTRGVLRLMAAVIHSLWERGDRSPLILPSTVPIDDGRVQAELTRYLSDNWAPILEKDVDGPVSLPLKIDSEMPNLGKVHATRRVARTIYLGSAPTSTAANRGLEDRRIRLGCVMPGEVPAVFGDALRRLAASATYLYQDGPRAWYATQPTVTKLADDLAEQLTRDPDKVTTELDRRMRDELKRPSDFARVHPFPRSSAEVPDDYDVRLVVLSVDHPHTKEATSLALEAAKALLESRGSSPRLFRNTLIFLAADKVRLQDLEGALRRYLAWTSILGDVARLNLDPHQVRQAQTQKDSADAAVNAQIPETFLWVLVPEQTTPQSPVTWNQIRVTGTEGLTPRIVKKLRSEDLYLSGLASTELRKKLDDIPLWDGNHVAVQQLLDYFARYLYLPRLSRPDVLLQAIRDGVGLLLWQTESFALAEGFDGIANRYTGLQFGKQVMVNQDSRALLVKPNVAKAQTDAELAALQAATVVPSAPSTGGGTVPPSLPPRPSGSVNPVIPPPVPPTPASTQPKRYYGTVTLDSTRVGRDAGRIADELISHLAGLVGSQVTVTLEISAEVPGGVPDNIVRTVTENGRTLKFTSQGFESE